MDGELRDALAKTIERLGGTIASDHDADFTHFVTLPPDRAEPGRGFTKSFKALSALAAGAGV